jgi:hypothetical protein
MFRVQVRWLATAMLLLLGSGPALADTHALIVTNSAYRNGVPPLAGVLRDASNAVAIARAIGVPEGNIVRIGDADLPALEAAFAGLIGRVRRNDQVFIYYSGHGGRQNLPQDQRCAESLVTVEGRHFPDTTMEVVVEQLSAKAEKVFLFVDACHSGGITTRAGGAGGALRPKSWSGGDGRSCSVPVNLVTRGLKATRAPRNLLLVAAARDDEIAFDSDQGGLATLAWTKCISGEARDEDRSGGLTAEELRRCAQNLLDSQLAGHPDLTPPHIELQGNGEAVLTLATTAEAASPAHTLADIYNRRDDRRTVTARAANSRLKIGDTPLALEVASSHGGYVYVLMAGSDGTAFDLLFPNALDGDNRIDAGGTLRLPRRGWAVTAGGPAGTDHLLVMVSDQPRDFPAAGMGPAGPFSTLPNSGARNLLRQAMPQAAACPTCSAAYGAAMLTIEEVP